MAALPPPPNDLVRLIYEAREKVQDDGWRQHLGASLIGRPCSRELWYSFRWAMQKRFPGRILRLFDRGQREEEVFVSELRSIGCEVHEYDPATGGQWKLSAVHGHFGGSMDATCRGVPEAPKAWHVCEFKTHAAKSFRDLEAKGVEASKPEHYAQIQTYMHLSGMKRALYLAVNKDTDELYAERVKEDRTVGEGLLGRADYIIFSQEPPSRIHEDPSWWQCKFCDYRDICRGGSVPAMNCRTCLHTTPERDGEAVWSCEAWDAPEIPLDAQRLGCERHCYIPALLSPWAVQADVTGSGVIYETERGRFENGPGGVESVDLERMTPEAVPVVAVALETFEGAEVVR